MKEIPSFAVFDVITVNELIFAWNYLTVLKTGQIQDKEHFEILGSKHSLI